MIPLHDASRVSSEAMKELASFLESIYRRLNRSEYIDPDPLGVVREFGKAEDREIAALVASCLAVGRAPLICAASRAVLYRMGPSPRAFLEASGPQDLERAFEGFRYRFFTGKDISALLAGARALVLGYGSLGEAFSSFVRPRDATVLPALDAFVGKIRDGASFAFDGEGFAKNLLPAPIGRSACKRPLLMLRWLVRHDAVDPGGWDSSLAPRLVQPMDTHMTWVTARFGFISGKSAPNLAVALDVTSRFREISRDDPVRFDFALTRPGIRPDLDREDWFRAW